MLKLSPILFDLARTPGNKGLRTSGLLLWFALLAIYGGSVPLCCRAGNGLCAVYGSPDVIS